MDSSAEDHALAICNLVLRRQEVRDDEHLYRVAGLGLAERRAPQSILTVLGQAHALEKHDAVSVGVRVAMSEVDLVVIMCEFDGEGQRVKGVR